MYRGNYNQGKKITREQGRSPDNKRVFPAFFISRFVPGKMLENRICKIEEKVEQKEATKNNKIKSRSEREAGNNTTTKWLQKPRPKIKQEESIGVADCRLCSSHLTATPTVSGFVGSLMRRKNRGRFWLLFLS